MFRRLLSAIGFGATGPDDPESFTRSVAAVFQEHATDHKVQIIGPLQLSVSAEDGSSHMVYLENLFQICAANPDKQAEEVARFAKVLLKLSPDDPTLPKDVAPVVRDRAFVDEMIAAMRSRAAPDSPKQDLFFEPLGADLVILYVRDDPHTTSYLFRDQVEALHLGGKTLREVAMENLDRILPQVTSEGGHGFHFFKADGCYEPSLILRDRIWKKFREQVQGEIIFAIPARGLLFVADSAIPEALDYLRKTARELFEQEPYKISDKIYILLPDGSVDFFDAEQKSLSS